MAPDNQHHARRSVLTPQTLEAMIAEDEFGLLDVPADSEMIGDSGWTYGEARSIGEAIAQRADLSQF